MRGRWRDVIGWSRSPGECWLTATANWRSGCVLGAEEPPAGECRTLDPALQTREKIAQLQMSTKAWRRSLDCSIAANPAEEPRSKLSVSCHAGNLQHLYEGQTEQDKTTRTAQLAPQCTAHKLTTFGIGTHARLSRGWCSADSDGQARGRRRSHTAAPCRASRVGPAPPRRRRRRWWRSDRRRPRPLRYSAACTFRENCQSSKTNTRPRPRARNYTETLRIQQVHDFTCTEVLTEATDCSLVFAGEVHVEFLQVDLLIGTGTCVVRLCVLLTAELCQKGRSLNQARNQ